MLFSMLLALLRYISPREGTETVYGDGWMNVEEQTLRYISPREGTETMPNSCAYQTLELIIEIYKSPRGDGN